MKGIGWGGKGIEGSEEEGGVGGEKKRQVWAVQVEE